MFKTRIHECQVADGDEAFTFYVREPSGREMLELAAKQKKDAPALDNARDLFARYVVNKDGSPISAEEVNGILDMRLTAMQKVSQLVQDKIGLTELAAKKS